MRILILLGLLAPASASAQNFSGHMTDVVSIVSGPFLNGLQCSGPQCLTVLGLLLMRAFTPAIGIIAILMIVRAGFVLVYRGSDEELSKAKRSIASALTAIVLFFLAPRIVDIFYGGINFGGPGTALEFPQLHVGVLSTEILGFIRWLLVFVGVGAVLVIIISGLRTIISFGNDEGIAQLKRTLAGVIGGIMLLVFGEAIVLTLGLGGGAPTPIPLLIKIIEIVNNMLVFAGLLAFVVVVYAGFSMIVFLGSEEKFTAAKNLIFRSLAGIAVIMVSYMLMFFVMQLVGG